MHSEIGLRILFINVLALNMRHPMNLPQWQAPCGLKGSCHLHLQLHLAKHLQQLVLRRLCKATHLQQLVPRRLLTQFHLLWHLHHTRRMKYMSHLLQQFRGRLHWLRINLQPTYSQQWHSYHWLEVILHISPYRHRRHGPQWHRVSATIIP